MIFRLISRKQNISQSRILQRRRSWRRRWLFKRFAQLKRLAADKALEVSRGGQGRRHAMPGNGHIGEVIAIADLGQALAASGAKA